MKSISQLCAGLILATGLLGAQTPPGLSLDQFVQIGLENSSDIRIAERNLASARADRRSSMSGLIPRLSASVSQDLDPGKSFLRDGVPYEPTPFSSRISLSQTIFDGGNSWYNRQVGTVGVERAVSELERTHQQAIFSIQQAFYGYLSRVELREVAEEALKLSRRQLELVEERFRLQAVRETDLLKARVNVGQREVALLQADQVLINAATTLNLALGLDPSTPVSVVRDSVMVRPVLDREAALTSLMVHNPILRSQHLAVENARLNARIQRGSLLPTISLGYSQSADAGTLGEAFKYSSDKSSTGLSFSFPLFTGFQNSSRFLRARHSALAEEERLAGLERNLKGQLENTLSSLASLNSIYPINQDILASAEADVRLADEQYKLGAISILNLLDAQVSLITARSTLVRTTYDIKTAEAQLDALMGTIGQ